ncbi:MAG: hypothetical protein ACOC2L_01615 [Candidatus Sumerlaeota bacterium]
MESHILIAIHIHNREQEAVDVQRLLTEYGANIKTRLGLHETESQDSPSGVVLLEMTGNPNRCQELNDKLNALATVEARKIVFEHS